MKTSKNSFIIILILCLIISSCSNQQGQSNDELIKKVQDLENRVDILQSQLDSQQEKTRIAFKQVSSSLLFNSPWESFLMEGDNYWNNPVDVGYSECSSGCATAAKARMKECAKMLPGQKRDNCYSESTESSNRCNLDCTKNFTVILR